MRVGILTFHFGYNYGAVLQAYASVAALRALGHQPEIVDYVPAYFRPDAFHFRGLGLKNGEWKTAIPKRLKALPRRLKFDRFRTRYLPLSARVSDRELDSLSDRYDAFYVGSDQVWNLRWMHGFDGFYFLNFVRGSRFPVVGYAPCFGDSKQPQDRLALAEPLLKRFKYIATRNEFSAELLERTIGRPSVRVSDPTLLHDFSHFAQAGAANAKHILVYALERSTLSSGEAICRELRRTSPEAKVFFIGSEQIAEVSWADQCLSAADPSDWVALIASASAVVTDSFHGAIFALKFGRTLRAYSSGWRAGRLLDLFGVLDVPARSMDSAVSLWSVEADSETYPSIKKRMDSLARSSLEWLGDALVDISTT